MVTSRATVECMEVLRLIITPSTTQALQRRQRQAKSERYLIGGLLVPYVRRISIR